MKKKLSLLLAALILMTTVTGCGAKKEEAENRPVNIKVEALKGPTSMGMAKMIEDSKSENKDRDRYEFNISNSVDEVVPKIAGGKVDIAAVPSNLSSVLYNKTDGKIITLAINTLGILYVVENGGDDIHSVADLKGKTVYSSGKGATPEIAFNYILSKNGLKPGEDVKVEYKSEHTECLQALMKDPQGIAVLPQPFLTVAQSKSPKIKVALDLNEEWEKINKDKSSMITGVLVARKDFVEKNPQAVEKFMKKYKESIDFTNNDTDKAAAIIGKLDIVPEPIAKKAIPYCNITYIDGKKMKENLGEYLKILYDANPKSIGGKMPGEDFYYIQKDK